MFAPLRNVDAAGSRGHGAAGWRGIMHPWHGRTTCHYPIMRTAFGARLSEPRMRRENLCAAGTFLPQVVYQLRSVRPLCVYVSLPSGKGKVGREGRKCVDKHQMFRFSCGTIFQPDDSPAVKWGFWSGRIHVDSVCTIALK